MWPERVFAQEVRRTMSHTKKQPVDPGVRRRRLTRNAPLLVRLPVDGVALNVLLSTLENDLIDQALLRTEGNKLRAAALLGINRTTLIEKLRRRWG